MYKKNRIKPTSIEINESVEGESIETKIERMVKNKEKPDGTTDLLYSERSEGVVAGYNIRTDRWDVAIEAMDKATSSKIAKRDAAAQAKIVDMKPEKESGKPESTGGTSE